MKTLGSYLADSFVTAFLTLGLMILCALALVLKTIFVGAFGQFHTDFLALGSPQTFSLLLFFFCLGFALVLSVDRSSRLHRFGLFIFDIGFGGITLIASFGLALAMVNAAYNGTPITPVYSLMFILAPFFRGLLLAISSWSQGKRSKWYLFSVWMILLAGFFWRFFTS